MKTLLQSPPESLAQRGIARVTTNLDGREVALPAGLIMTFFGRELMARVVRREDGHATGNTAGAGSGE